jgi:uncharacterized protein GlcG (DUF336 family)
MATLTLDEARRVSAAAEARAAALGCSVSITVVDGGGHIRVQSRMDGTGFGTLAVSANKAFTAAAFGAPTKILADLTQPGQSLFGFADAAGGRIAVFGGGVPIVRHDVVDGAIGISGGSVDQDVDIADAAAAAL